MVVRQFDLEFTSDGQAVNPRQIVAVLDGLPGVSHLLVLCHSENTDLAAARDFYDRLSTFFSNLPQAPTQGVAILRIFWPSATFTEEDLLHTTVRPSDAALRRLLEGIALHPLRDNGSRASIVDRALSLIPELDDRSTARSEFASLIRSVLDPQHAEIDDGSRRFFELDANELFDAFRVEHDEMWDLLLSDTTSGLGTARTFDGEFASEIVAAASRIASYAACYLIKTHVDLVAKAGLAPLLSQVKERHPALRIHLAGHGYGARLVTVAAATLPTCIPVASLTLLQPALSHSAFGAKRYPRHHAGAFRGLLTGRRIAGPVVITHTVADAVVGVPYSIASRLSGDQSSALGDAQDDFGTLGRNGAQHTPEVSQAETTLGPPTARYTFAPGRVYNLNADHFISNHRDVANASVAGLLFNLMASDLRAPSPDESTTLSLPSDDNPQHTVQRSADPVDAAVFCPAAVARASVFLVQVFLYPPGAERAVSAEAHSADENAAHRGAYSLPLDLPHGTRVDVRLDFGVLNVAEPDAVIVWRARAASVQFEAAVPKDATQSNAIGRVRFAVGGVPAGTLRFQVTLVNTDTPSAAIARRPVQGVKYRQAFVSYSSADRAEVLRRVQAFKIAGISVFQDILDLDPGERWERALYREIDRCDVFFLFWSRAAATSEWVTREIEYALSRQGGDENRPPEIQPVPIEGPPVVPPPKNLSHLHFNDALLAHIGGSTLPPPSQARSEDRDSAEQK